MKDKPFDLADILNSLGISTEETKPLSEREAVVNAYAKTGLKKFNKVYQETQKAVEKEIKYVSAGHLMTGVVALLYDAIYITLPIVKEVIESPKVKEIIEEKGYGSVEEMIFGEMDEKAPMEQLKSMKGFGQLKTLGKYMNNTIDNILEVSKKKRWSPEKVINSKREMLKIITKSYDSFENYENKQKESIGKMYGYVDQINSLKPLIPLFIQTQVNAKDIDLEEWGIKTSTISNIVGGYLTDLTTFAATFLKKSAEYSEKELSEYKKLLQK